METPKTYQHNVKFWMDELLEYTETFENNSKEEQEVEILLRIFRTVDELRDKMMGKISKSFIRKHSGKTELDKEEQLMVIREYLETSGGRAGYDSAIWDYSSIGLPRHIISAASTGEDQKPVAWQLLITTEWDYLIV